MALLKQLSKAFDEIARDQVIKASRKNAMTTVATNGTAFLLDGAGFIPIAGNILSGIKMALSAPDIIFNLYYLIKNRKQLGAAAVVNELKDRRIRRLIKNSSIDSQSYFYDAVKLINEVSSIRRQL